MTNKEKILKAASELLLERGLEGLSVRAISKAAGLSTIAIYSHFQGKEGVLDALYIEGFELVRQATESAQVFEDPIESAMQGCANYLRIAEENEGHYRLIFGETGGAYTPSIEAKRTSITAFDALVAQTGRLMPPGTTRSQKERAALRVWAILHGYVSLRHHIIGNVLDDRQWKNMVMESIALTISKLASGEDVDAPQAVNQGGYFGKGQG